MAWIDKHSKSQVSLLDAAQCSPLKPQTLVSPSPQLLRYSPSPLPGLIPVLRALFSLQRLRLSHSELQFPVSCAARC